jgi:putative holliday junction resolvase
MSILGLDLGKRRIGVAIADTPILGVRPLATLVRGSLPQDFDTLRALAVDWQVRRIILGLPLNMNGSEGTSARHAREFAGQLTRALGLPVELYDERLTSFEAKSRLKDSALKRGARKLMVDQIAATVILEGWLAEHGAEPDSSIYTGEAVGQQPTTKPARRDP